MKLSSSLRWLAVAVFGMASCADVGPGKSPVDVGDAALSRGPATAGSRTFLVISRTSNLPRGLEQQVQQAGGRIVGTVPEIGVLMVEGQRDFAVRAARFNGVQSVVADIEAQFLDPNWNDRSVTLDQVGNPPFSGSDNVFFDLQWGHTAIEAPAAWSTGERGNGVRVAVLDSGIDSNHPDLIPNLNVALSTSFVPDEAFNSPAGNHGTHVAGTIAAADNAFGVIGVAPEAELVAVKVLGGATGSGTFGGLIAGIVYAANIDADIINMSLGVRLLRRGAVFSAGQWVDIPSRDVAELVNLVGRATQYAYHRGTTIVTSAGNGGTHRNFTRDMVVLPADLPHVISVSATGPLGWALDFGTDLDRPASYTEHGKARIDFAAPGGDFLLPGNAFCTVGIVTHFCWVFDMVFSTLAGGWGWSAGTSMASPHLSGVAALIIGKNGGPMHPAQVETRLRQTADSPGKPGKDDFYGHGRVNAFKAVQ